jgi:predicted dehydrogenase
VINAAIIGLGGWGRNLVNHIQGKSDKIRIVAGYARTPDKVRDYARQQGFAVYDSLDKVLGDPAIQAVIVATPHTLRTEPIIAAARAGKHVFTEKPLALTKEEADHCVRICAENNVTLAVGYNWRFQPALQEIKRMLEDGRLGKLCHIEGNFCGPSAYRFPKEHWRQKREEGPAGGMTGRGVHVVDAMVYLSGRVDSVFAQSYRLVHDWGIDDTTSMLFRFANGVTGYLGTFIATAETWRMQIFGSNGWAEVGDVKHLTTWSMRVCFVNHANLHEHHAPQTITFPDMSTERAELENFADAIATGRRLAVAGGDEVHNAAIVDAIMESATKHAPVKVI